MVITLDVLHARRHEILEIARRRGARNVRVFGSVARGDADGTSDLDLLVDMEEGRTLVDLAAMERELSELLGCRVEVGTALTPRVRARVLREAVALSGDTTTPRTSSTSSRRTAASSAPAVAATTSSWPTWTFRTQRSADSRP
jgi:uncharacterized protein